MGKVLPFHYGIGKTSPLVRTSGVIIGGRGVTFTLYSVLEPLEGNSFLGSLVSSHRPRKSWHRFTFTPTHVYPGGVYCALTEVPCGYENCRLTKVLTTLFNNALCTLTLKTSFPNSNLWLIEEQSFSLICDGVLYHINRGPLHWKTELTNPLQVTLRFSDLLLRTFNSVLTFFLGLFIPEETPEYGTWFPASSFQTDWVLRSNLPSLGRNKINLIT